MLIDINQYWLTPSIPPSIPPSTPIDIQIINNIINYINSSPDLNKNILSNITSIDDIKINYLKLEKELKTLDISLNNPDVNSNIINLVTELNDLYKSVDAQESQNSIADMYNLLVITYNKLNA